MIESKEENGLFTDWKSILSTLGERESKVVMYRFGLLDLEPCTLEQVGDMMGVTRERIRQIEAKALRKMRHRASLLGVKFEDYFEQ